MNDEPWMRTKDAAQRLGCTRQTIWRLCQSGILRRVFEGVKTKGVTIESVAQYEAGLQYRDLREQGKVPTLPWAAKDQSPLHHLLVTGKYPDVPKVNKEGNVT